MITDTTSLAEWRARAQRQPKGRTVLDLEADSLHRHREKLCLIQYGDEEGETIIDPLVIEDMRLFTQWLEGAEVWMHGADYDMTLLQRAYGILPAMIWDTQIAARLLGFRQFGLAALVEHYFGVVMSKKNQKADWGRRPMPPDMLEYAQGDVKYMLNMADTMVAALREKGRYEWFTESCEHHLQRGRERFGEAHDEPWRIKGCGKLNRRGLAALRALWTWRDAEAAEWDRPSFMVCGNEHLLRWSQALQEFRPVTPLHSFHAHRAARFNRAVEQFQLLDEDEYPKRPQREHREVDAHFDERVEALISRRNSVAEKLDLEPSLIASRVQIEAIAADRDTGMAQLMRWQRELLA
ncbi:MAG: hypothetical protein MR894_06165 [Akkermansia muciniphila]|nr:hypothetical protein [Akkermansia muciniphila]